MKILYGIQGTGNGHLARARALVPELKKKGIELDFVFSGRKREDFFDMSIFGDDFLCFDGFTFITEQGRIKKIKTLRKNNIALLFNDIRKLNVSDYDLVLSDFEPISAWAAKIHGIPSIGMSHQCAFDHKIPKVTGYALEKLLMRYFAPTHTRIGLHWHHFDQSILPPLIEKLPHAEIKPNKILVYMGFEAINDVRAFVSGFSEYEFHIYASVAEKVELGHVTIHPLCHEGFHRDLSDASGVISNAGFELASECLQLGKKLLIKPLLGQYEQACNALALQQLKRATVIDTLDQDMLKAWLAIDTHPPINYPFVAQYLADWIYQRDFTDIQQLTQKLWEETDFSCPELSENITHISSRLIY